MLIKYAAGLPRCRSINDQLISNMSSTNNFNAMNYMARPCILKKNTRIILIETVTAEMGGIAEEHIMAL